VWFNEQGMTAGHGTSALENPQFTMSWQEIETQVRSQVENGTYMGANEVYLVDEAERGRIAAFAAYFFWDGIGEAPEEIFQKAGNRSDAHAKMTELLSSPEGITLVTSCMDKALHQLETGEKKLRFRSVMPKEELRAELDNLLLEKKTFPVSDSVEVKKEDFITQDEIDHRLGRGSGFEHGSFRIYDYFMEGHNSKEAADFLKREYGTGGSSHALAGADHSWEDHNFKGISLKKGDLSEPYADVLLSWKVVENRIRKLIQEDKYLSPEAKEAYAEYKKAQARKELAAQTEPEQDISGEPGQAAPEKAAQIDKSNAANFHITDDALGIGSAKEKFRRNAEAIRTLEKIEGENRMAAPEEQKILSQYVGWGGLADAFDSSKANWADEYQELKSLLSPEEYASARESTLNAHYTSPVIIRSIYEVLDRMGFEKGNILEPAMGIGNFFGMLPETMQESRLYGVELDGITGRIAKQLYPKADIKISGFEKTDYPNDFFDVAVGNVPFGQYKVSDRQYDKHNFLIHDYFFAKTLDKVRPGGIVAFVTSKGTMDKKNPEVRKYLAQRAELLGAVRLPNTAFKENAGTEVTSDILFLKKRDRVLDIEPDWVHLTEKDGIVMNQYFADHPEMVLGKMEMVSGAHGMESACLPDTSLPLSAQLKNALSYVEGSI